MSLESVPSRDLPDYAGGALSAIWPTVFNASIVPIFSHKLRGKHKKDVIAGLAIKGPCTLYSLAKDVLDREARILVKKKKVPPSKHISKRKDIYHKIVEGRQEGKSTYSGLIEQGYLIPLKGPKGERHYFLSLAGCIIATGFDFTNNELQEFIENASKHYAFFSFLKKLIEAKLPARFIVDVFIEPIRKMVLTMHGSVFRGKSLDVHICAHNIPFFINDHVGELRCHDSYKKLLSKCLEKIRSEKAGYDWEKAVSQYLGFNFNARTYLTPTERRLDRNLLWYTCRDMKLAPPLWNI